MLLVEGSSEAGLFKHFNNDDFRVRIFGITRAVRVIFFSKFLKFNLDGQNEAKKIRKLFFVSEIIASELVSLDCLS